MATQDLFDTPYIQGLDLSEISTLRRPEKLSDGKHGRPDSRAWNMVDISRTYPTLDLAAVYPRCGYIERNAVNTYLL